MALQATVHRFDVSISDVDRGVYETLDLRVARHPSESARYLFLRVLGYALAYEEGIAFSKGGLSDTDEPPLAVRDRTGQLLAWIDIGLPSADRLHKAAKAAPRVVLFTAHDLANVRKEAASREIHKKDQIVVEHVERALLDALEERLDRHMTLGVTRNDGRLYVTVGDATLEGAIEQASLVAPD
jgi:uncharacterized protein YaeQ